MRKQFQLFVGATLLASIAAVPVVGQPKPPLKCYVGEFYFEPLQKPVAPVWIPEKDPIFESRLLPINLFEVEQPVIVAGEEWLRAGDQMMSMRSRTSTRCNFPQMRDKTIAARERICVFDDDGDGVFDQIHKRSRGGVIWFAMAWQHPKKDVQAVDPVAMKPIDSLEFKGGPKVTYRAYHTPLRRKPRDGSDPYWEAFTEAMMRGNDGLKWRMQLRTQYGSTTLRGGDAVNFEGLVINVMEVAEEKARIAYVGDFAKQPVDLPFRNSYERKCDTYRSNAF